MCVIDKHHGWSTSLKPPVLGFILSLLLVSAMYRFVTRHELSGPLLTWTIFTFAIMQALVGLIFFLHLGLESKPRWSTISFLFMALVLFVIIGGSLWIMYNLNYNLMPTMEH